MSKKRSPIWIYFDENTRNGSYADCKVCRIHVYRGSENARNRTTKLLYDHLRKWHKDEYKIVEDINKGKTGKKATSSMENGNNAGPSTSGANAGSSIVHGSNTETSIGDEIPKSLRTKQERHNAFQQTIPEWTESQNKMPFNSKKAQEFHLSIFEMLVLDSRPFSMVNDRGFLRHHQKLVPNFEVILNVSTYIFCPLLLWKRLYSFSGGQ